MLVAAKWWASQGVPVFPLNWPTRQGDRWACSCGKSDCSSAAKHPLTTNGLDDATTDLDIVDGWWKKWPNANIGLRTGVAFDLFDVDGPAGFASLQTVIEKLGGEPQAAAVCVSGRIDGGRHYYMQPAGKKALAGGKTSPTGLDVKGNGGYAVGPPSRHISGTEYRWENGLQYGNVTGTVPWEAVYDELVRTAPKKKPRERHTDHTPPAFTQPPEVGGDRVANFGKAVLRSIVEEMDAAVSGHRWDTFATECAMKLARAIEGGSVDRAEGTDALQYAARRAGLDDEEIERLPDLIDDALAKGITDPIAPKAEDGGEPPKAWQPEEIEQTGWEPPQPLNRPVPDFPTAALGWLEDDVVALAHDLQTPVDLVAMLTLATLSAAVQGRAYVRVRGTWTEPLNLYVLVLAGAGETKSPALAQITKPLRELEKRRADSAAVEIGRRRQARRLQEGRLKRAEAAAIAATGEDRQVREHEADRERAALEAMPEAVAPRLLAGDTTAEGLVRLLAEQGGVMASLTAEGGLFDTLAGGRYSNGMANLDAVLQAHDGREPILVDRKVGDPIRVDNPCLTLGLAVQPQVLETAGESDAAVGRGFLARFLFSYPASRVGGRDVFQEPSGRSFADIADAVEGIDRLLSPSVQGFADIADVSPRNELRLTTTTLGYLNAFRAELEPRRGPSGDLASITAWAAKLDGQVARLAGLLQLLFLSRTSAISAKPRRSTLSESFADVEADAMASATAIGEYLIEHSIAAHRLMSGRHFSATHPASQLLAWLRENEVTDFSIRDVHDRLRRRTDFHEAEAVATAALVLERHGYLRLLANEKRPGRPTVRYAVNPLEP